MKIVFVFKNGNQFSFKCDNFILTKSNITGNVIGYECEGISDNKPLYIDFSEILYIYRDLKED